MIWLVDALYEHRVMSVFSAERVATEIFDASDVSSTRDETFAFDRVVSRLIEMQSEEYLQEQHLPEHEPPAEAERGDAPFLLRFETALLTDDDVTAIWLRFDADGSGSLDRAEVSFMLEELSELRNGHRSMPEEVLEQTWQRLDADGSGYIDEEEFRAYMRQYGLEVSWAAG